MKLHFLLIALMMVAGMQFASAKNHHGKHRTKKAAITPRSSEMISAEQNDLTLLPHEITNKKLRPNTRKQGKLLKNKNHEMKSSGTTKKSEDTNQSLHKHIIEHNINKKSNDQNGIQLEREQLIHVTPLTTKVNKKSSQKKQEKRNNRMRNKVKRAESRAAKKASMKKQLKKQTNKKYPKKFTAKVHGWKKIQKKEKTEKLKEKRDRQLQRLKALKNAKSGQRKA